MTARPSIARGARRRFLAAAAAMAAVTAVPGCLFGRPASRLGMVEQPGTGLMFGSLINGSVFTDPEFLPNRRLKVTVRNTSGDVAWDLGAMRGLLESAYLGKGYEPSDGADFGIKVDVNVRYSSHAHESLETEFAFLGAVMGHYVSSDPETRAAPPSSRRAAATALAGASLGAVLGSYVTDDTYIVIAAITVGVRDMKRRTRKVVTFSRSETLETWDEDDGFGTWKTTSRIEVAAYAGGAMAGQADIADEVRRRLIRIVGDVI